MLIHIHRPDGSEGQARLRQVKTDSWNSVPEGVPKIPKRPAANPGWPPMGSIISKTKPLKIRELSRQPLGHGRNRLHSAVSTSAQANQLSTALTVADTTGVKAERGSEVVILMDDLGLAYGCLAWLP
jgi:hypothetical protein